MPNIGPLEIIVLLIIALVVFGPKRLPELGRSMGKGIREFRGSVTGKHDDDDDDDEEMRSIERSQAQAKAQAVESVEGEVVTDHRA
jgi:sec-independent protein translocase protein TatA